MKAAIISTTLLFSFCLNVAAQENVIFDYSSLSADIDSTDTHPKAAVNPVRAEAMQLTLSSDYSYIRCGYRLKNAAKNGWDATSSWMWALNPNDPSKYAIVYGHWAGSLPLTNMFYTQVDYQQIKKTCEFSLKKNKIDATDITPYAGNYALSWYYTFWNENPSAPQTKIGNVSFDRMVIFGDSLSDTINLYNSTYGTIPQSSTWFFGHFSNGLVWHEHLSNEKTHIPGYIWASANSESGDKLVFPSLSSQIKKFSSYMKSAKNYNINKTLFFIFVGGNDFVTGGKTADEVLKNHTDGINNLLKNGAKYIAIFRLPNFSIVPTVKKWSHADKNALKNKSVEFNIKLEKLVSELRQQNPSKTILTLHTDKILDDVLSDKESFGLVDVENACLDIGQTPLSYAFPHSPTKECVNSNANFMFWDNMHPTTKTHAILAEAIYSELSEQLRAVTP